MQTSFVEYSTRAPIGWHRDIPQFSVVIGVSLGEVPIGTEHRASKRNGCRSPLHGVFLPNYPAKLFFYELLTPAMFCKSTAFGLRPWLLYGMRKGDANGQFVSIRHLPAEAILRHSCVYRSIVATTSISSRPPSCHDRINT